MLLSEPARTAYDFEFELLGFSVRVSPWFWAAALFLGYPFSQAYQDSRGTALVIWVAVMFVSILIHELGHALAFRKYGTHSSIVLYHFGGLAIPQGSFRSSFRGGGMNPYHRMFVSFAGPGIQLLLALVLILTVRATDYALPNYLQWIPGLQGGNYIESHALDALVRSALFANVFWAVLNLIPIWPLDGGQITRELVQVLGGTVYHSSVISIAFCMIAGVLAYQSGFGSIFTYLFLASFAYTNYQIIDGGANRWR